MIMRYTVVISLALLSACVARDPLQGATDATGPGTSDTTAPTTGPTSAGETITGASTGTSTTTSAGETTTGASTSAEATSQGGTTNDIFPCNEHSVLLAIAPLDVMFVLDESALLTLPPSGLWDHDGDDLDDDGLQDDNPGLPATPRITRWESLHRVTAEIVARYDASLHAGLSLFPAKTATSTYDITACPVATPAEVDVAPNHAAAVVAAMPPAATTDLKGALPASNAIAEAVAALQAHGDEHRRQIVFVTSGPANCRTGAVGEALFESYDETLHERVSEAFALDAITTHVVGLQTQNSVSPNIKDGHPDGVNPFAELNELAVQGGAPAPGDPKFLAADDEAALLAALDTAVRRGLSCLVPLTEEPFFPDFVRVIIDDKLRKPVNDCVGTDGWRYANAPPFTAIELCGQTCADFQAAGVLEFKTLCPSD